MTATHVNTGKYVMTNYLIDTHAHLDMVINNDEEKRHVLELFDNIIKN